MNGAAAGIRVAGERVEWGPSVEVERLLGSEPNDPCRHLFEKARIEWVHAGSDREGLASCSIGRGCGRGHGPER